MVSLNFFYKTVATFGGVGYFPVAPGTAATAVGVGLFYLLGGAFLPCLLAILAFFAVGVMASGHVEKSLNQKDPGIVVIDEIVGVLISLAGLPLTWPVALSGFFLFRAFDMFKIYPVNRLEAIPGGWGIMLDDVMAGVYTNIVLRVALYFAIGH